MKRASQVTLMVSCGCLLTGVGGIAAPALRDSLTFRLSVPVKEDAAPPATPLTPPGPDAPRFIVKRLQEGVPSTVFQAFTLNNKGEVLCTAEDRERYEVPGRNGKPPIVRYRTVRTRYMIYKDGVLRPVVESTDTQPFRPVAFNNRDQILGFRYDPKEPPHVDYPVPPTTVPGSSFFGTVVYPSPRNCHLVLWENGSMRDLPVIDPLVKAGMPRRLQYFLDASTVALNDQTQILIGLQNLYLWDNGTAHRVGSSGIGLGDRIFLNNRGTTVRRADQYRTSPDGASVYPLIALYPAQSRVPRILDLGYGTFAFDLNDQDEILLGKMYMPTSEMPRTRFSIWNRTGEQTLFTINGRSPGRFNNRGMAIAWRQTEGSQDWRAMFSGGSMMSMSSTPVLWYRGKLYDLNSLLVPGGEIVTILDLNDRGEFLAQLRTPGKMETVLLAPQWNLDSPAASTTSPPAVSPVLQSPAKKR